MSCISTSSKIKLNVIKNEKFTGNVISVYFINHLDGNISKNTLLAFILKNSNEKYQSLSELNSYLDKNYGANLSLGISKCGENQVIKFTLAFIKDKFAFSDEKITENMGDLLYNVLRCPNIKNGSFDKNVFETEKNNVKNLILSRINNKRTYAITRCILEMCKDEDYGCDVYGSIDNLDKITPEEISSYYEKFIFDSEVYLQFIGDMTEDFAKRVADKLFSDKKTNEEKRDIKIIKSASEIKEIEENLDVKQSVLVMGYRMGIDFPNQDSFSYAAANSVLGGNAGSSLLFKSVREKLSLCYFCSSLHDLKKGILFIVSGISSENKEKTVNAIKEQVEILKKGDFTDNDLAVAKADMINQYSQIGDSMADIDSFEFDQFYKNSEMTVTDYIENIKKVSRDDVVKAAEKLTLDTVYFLSEKKGDNQ